MTLIMMLCDIADLAFNKKYYLKLLIIANWDKLSFENDLKNEEIIRMELVEQMLN